LNYEQALEQLGLNPDIRLRQMFELGRLAAPVQQKPLFADIIAKHSGLAEELKAMDAAPVPLTPEQINLLINGRGDEDDDDYVEPTGDVFGLTDEDLVKLVRRVEASHGITKKGQP
jgi:hypothetical protein